MILTDRQKMKSEQEKKAWLPITIQNGGVRTFKDNFKEARLLFKVLKGGQHIHFIFGDKKAMISGACFTLKTQLTLETKSNTSNPQQYYRLAPSLFFCFDFCFASLEKDRL